MNSFKINKYICHLPLVAINMIPVTGFLFFGWSLKGIFLYYTIELCAYEMVMLPRIVIFVFTGDEYGYNSVLKNIGTSVSWILYNLMMFGFTIMFMLATAFPASHRSSLSVTEEIMYFLKGNMVFVVIIFGEYLYSFFKGYLYDEGYKKIPSQNQLWEIGIFFVLLQLILGIFHALSVMVSLDNNIYQVIMILLVVFFKIAIQFIVKIKIEG